MITSLDELNLDAITQALLDCLRSAPQAPDSLARLRPDDWVELFRLAKRHRVHVLVYARIKTWGLIDHLPRELSAAQQKIAVQAGARSQDRLRRLCAILNAFQAASIPVIVLKGAYLAYGVYPELAWRSMVDVDLLARQEDISTAANVLLALGYHPSEEYQLELILHELRHLPAFKRSGWPVVELHWKISAPSRTLGIDMEGIWQRIRPVPLGGAQALALSPEDMLLHLSIHTINHHLFQAGLCNFLDVDLLLRSAGAFDWPALIARVDKTPVARTLCLMLRLAQLLLHTPIPENAFAYLPNAEITDDLVNLCLEMMFVDRSSFKNVTPNLARMLTSNEPKAKLAVLLKSVFIPPPLIAAEYKLSVHSPKLLLVYFSRFGTMLQRFGHIAWAFVSGAPDMRTNVIRKSDVVKSEASLVSWLYEEPSPWKI